MEFLPDGCQLLDHRFKRRSSSWILVPAFPHQPHQSLRPVVGNGLWAASFEYMINHIERTEVAEWELAISIADDPHRDSKRVHINLWTVYTTVVQLGCLLQRASV